MGMFEDFKTMRDDLFDSFSDFVTSAIIKDGLTNTYNPATSSNVSSYSINEILPVYLKDYSSSQVIGEILAGDVEILVNTEETGINISASASIEVNSKVYKVITPMPVPKTNPVMFRCHCRGIADA